MPDVYRSAGRIIIDINDIRDTDGITIKQRELSMYFCDENGSEQSSKITIPNSVDINYVKTILTTFLNVNYLLATERQKLLSEKVKEVVTSIYGMNATILNGEIKIKPDGEFMPTAVTIDPSVTVMSNKI
jgi:hypothetical protein